MLGNIFIAVPLGRKLSTSKFLEPGKMMVLAFHPGRIVILLRVNIYVYYHCNRPKSCNRFNVFMWCTTSFLSEYIKKYATEEALKDQEEMSSSSESSISDFSEDEAQDMEL